MKNLIFLSLLFLAGCDGLMEYGFSHNPIKVIQVAQDAINTESVGKWQSVSEGKIYCKYGSRQALRYLKSQLNNFEIQDAKMKRLSRAHLQKPRWHAFWIYRQDTYLVNIESNSGTVLEAVVNCYFGESIQDEKYLAKKNYSKAYCSLVMMNPIAFPHFSGNQVCD